MTAWILPLMAGLLSGILSAWGIGGGTLLLLIMTLFLDVDPRMAQSINLLYFLPTAAAGLLYHRKHDLLDKTAIRSTALWGIAAAIAGAVLATVLDTALLRRPFGIYLIIMGAIICFTKKSSAVQNELRYFSTRYRVSV